MSHLNILPKQLTNSFAFFLANESGQAITEYGAMLAFVATMVAVVFGVSHGGLAASVSCAFSEVGSQLNSMSSEAASAQSS